MGHSASSRSAHAAAHPQHPAHDLSYRPALPIAPAAGGAPAAAAPNAGRDDFAAALARIRRSIEKLGRIRRRHAMDLDDLLILAACGAINFAPARRALPFAQPANVTSIAEYVRVPRETVRRKLQAMEEKGFVARSSGGYCITDAACWLALVGVLGGEPMSSP